MDSANRILKKSNKRSIFIKVSATLTLLPFLASTNLYTMALANDQSGRGAAWQQFKLDNPGMKGGELNRLFKAEWGGANFKTHIPQAHTQNIEAAGTVNLQSTNQPTVIDLSQAGTTINQGVQSGVDTNGNVTITADPGANVGNVQLINAPTNNVINLGNSVTLNAAGNTSGGNINVTTTDAINLNTNAGSINVGSGSTVVNAGTIGSNTQVNTTNVSVVVSGSNTSTGGLTAPTTPINLGSNSSLNITPIVGGGKTPHIKEPKVPHIKEPKIPQIKEPKVPHIKEPKIPQIKEPKVPVVKEPKVPHVKEPKMQSFAPQTVQQVASKVIGINGGIALDLGSAAETITLGDKLFQNQESVTINVGGQEKTFSAGSKVTAAEYVAAKQVMSGTSQTVILDSDGRATGGQIDLSALTSGNNVLKVTDLTVPVAVTASGDFGKGGDVVIKGDLTNAGVINAFNSNGGQLNAAIRADNITNNEGASITSTVSDFTLQADKSLSNFGNISANGNLTLSAGKSLTNSGDVSVQQNLNVLSRSVTNSGTLASVNADVKLDTPVPTAMFVNNAGGTIAALNGAINVRNADYVASFDTKVTGGDLLSKEVNAFTGGGTTDIFVNELTGVVNTSGTAAHVSADTSDLIIGNQCLIGDPTYYNTGNIILGGNIAVGEDLAIIAGGNITTDQTFLSIAAQNAGGQGFDIHIIAGANVPNGTGQVNPAGGPATLPSQSTGSISQNNPGSLTFSGASATGGSIDLTSATHVVLSSSSSSGDLDGGNITLAAFSDGNGLRGAVFLPNSVSSSISASGSGSGTNGNVTVISGASGGNAVNLGTINNTGGTGTSANSGNVSIIVADPTINGASITFGPNGSVTSGTAIVASNTLFNGNVSYSSISAAGDVTIRTAGRIDGGNIGAGLGSSNGRNLTLEAREMSVAKLSAQHNGTPGNGGNISLTTNSTFDFNIGTAGVNSTGLLSVSAGSVGDGGTISIVNRGSGGITVSSHPDLTVTDGNGGNLVVDAGTGTLNFNAPLPIDLSGVGTNKSGGSFFLRGSQILSTNNVSLTAAATGSGTGGIINVQSTDLTGQVAIGSGAGQFSLNASGGEINIVAGQRIVLTATGSLDASQINLQAGNLGIDSQRAISADDIRMISSGTIFIGGAGNNLTATNTIDLTSSAVDMNNVVLTANHISIFSQTGQNLTLRGIGAGGTLTSTGGTYVSSGGTTLTLDGTMNYNGSAYLSGQNITALGASVNTATDESFLITNNLTGSIGAEFINNPGPWVIATSGTWANNPGSVTLNGSLVFSGGNTANGGNLAIIASGDITVNGTIDLTGTTGGSLLMIAGFTFDPNTGGTQKFDSATLYNNFSPAGSGSVTVTGNINTSSTTTGTAGVVNILANGGNITVADITATGLGGGFGGGVTLYASGDISAGNIDTRGTLGAGTVNIASTNPGLSINFQVQNGQGSGGILKGFLNSGAIQVGSISSGESQVVLETAGNGSVALGGAVNSSSIEIRTGSLTLTSSQTLAASSTASGAGGSLIVDVDTATSTVGSGTVLFSATGLLNNDGGTIEFTSNSTSASTISNTGQYAFNVGTTGSGEGGTLTASFAGDVSISTGGVVADGSGGTTATIVSAGNIAVNSGAFSLASQAGDGSTVSLTAGNTLTLNDTTFFGQANGTDTNSNGGGLLFKGTNIVTPGLGTSVNNAFVMTATGNGTGNGGTILFDTRNVTPILVGQPARVPKGAAFFFEADASGGGNGGSITVNTGGSLTISDTALVNADRGTVGNLNGAKYEFGSGLNPNASNPTLIINGSLGASALGSGNGGLIRLTSRSSKGFTIGVANPKNGISGQLDAFGNFGLVEVINNAGGISFGALGNISSSDVRFVMSGKGGFTAATGTVVRAFNLLTFSAQNGSIGSGNKFINVDTPTLQVDTAGKGAVSINNTYSFASTLNDSSSGGSFTLRTAQGVTLNDIITASKGTILVTSGGSGNLVVADDSRITASSGALTLQNTNTSGSIQIGADAVVETQARGKNTTLVVGATVPRTGTNPTTTTVGGINVSTVGKGVVFLGGTPGNESVVATTTANVNAINKNVIFSGPAGSIILGDDSTVTADPPSPAAIAQTASFVGPMSDSRPISNTRSSTDSMSSLFALVGENSTVTSDLSVANLNASKTVQASNNAMLFTNTSRMDSYEEDNSYVVGFCSTTGETESAICTDALLLAETVARNANAKQIDYSEHVAIKNGNVLFVPLKDTTVETPSGTVSIAAKSVVLVSFGEAGLAVYDLDDQHKGAVVVESNGHNVVLAPGRHVMITKHHTAEFAQINAVETIAHRNVQSVVKNGHRAHTSEFSVLTAMDTVKPLKALASSKHANARQIAARMMKTTAIILQLGGGSGGQYQHYFKPRLTAKL
ncbi:MAG: hypothetical protein DKT66_21295 [Candidatus Melainabacteria bacterium]|nr:MAG: hypothetical protein DKT66_21295 [Candidatus Melainabacteria bacterium]